GGQSVRTIFSSAQVKYDRDGSPATFWGLHGSASRKDTSLFVTAVNPDTSSARETEITVRGASVKSGSMTVLTAPDIHAYNKFDATDAVVPKSAQVKITSAGAMITAPPASVVAVQLDLG